MDASHADNPNSSVVLNMILELVTSIDNRMKNMEKNIEKRLDGIKQEILSVSGRVRTLENQATEFHKKLSDCETSCQGVSNLFDKANAQIKQNTRNIIHQNTRIQELEKNPIVQPVVQPVVESEEIRKLKEAVLDLKCRSMKNNLIFSGLHRVRDEDTESLLRCFLNQELGIEYHIEFGNIHRFNSPHSDYRKAPIVARFLYHRDLEYVLSIAYRLKGKPYGIREQFPPEIEQRRKPLYPVMRKAKQQYRQAKLVRDRLYIDNELYVPDETVGDGTTRYGDRVVGSPTNQHTTPKEVSPTVTPPSKRQCQRHSDSSQSPGAGPY